MKVDFAGQKNVSHIFFSLAFLQYLLIFILAESITGKKKSDYILNFFPLQATCIFFPSQWQAILSTITLLGYSFLSSFEWTLSNMVYF